MLRRFLLSFTFSSSIRLGSKIIGVHHKSRDRPTPPPPNALECHTRRAQAAANYRHPWRLQRARASRGGAGATCNCRTTIKSKVTHERGSERLKVASSSLAGYSIAMAVSGVIVVVWAPKLGENDEVSNDSSWVPSHHTRGALYFFCALCECHTRATTIIIIIKVN